MSLDRIIRPENLVGYWKGGNLISGTLYDKGLTKANGTAVENPTIVQGKTGAAIQFGTGKGITIPYSTTLNTGLNVGNTFTIEALVNTDNITSNNPVVDIFSMRIASNALPYNMIRFNCASHGDWIHGDTGNLLGNYFGVGLFGYNSGAGGWCISSDNSIFTGGIKHLVATFNGIYSNTKLYVNGISIPWSPYTTEKTTVNPFAGLTSATFGIGCVSAGGVVLNYPSWIDYVKLYNTPLTERQIKDIYNSKK